VRQFFLPGKAFENGKARLEGDAFFHLSRVLRSRPGDELLLAGPQGRWKAVLTVVEKAWAEAELREAVAAPTGGPRLRLAACLTKGGAFEDTLDACTQLGIVEFLPLISERTVVRLKPSEYASKMARWSKILTGAAEQSNQPEVPMIHAPRNLAAAEEEFRRGITLWAWEGLSGNLQQSLGPIPSADPVNLVVGPEGGFTESEVSFARALGVTLVTLGRGLMKAPVAAARLVSLVQFRLAQNAP
jgi:16S rRNA (uracil1498-N3)-methyltransferase